MAAAAAAAIAKRVFDHVYYASVRAYLYGYVQFQGNRIAGEMK